MEKLIKVFIKSEVDLPTKGRYLAKFDRHLMASIIQHCDYDDNMKEQWMAEVDYYYRPQTEAEVLEEKRELLESFQKYWNDLNFTGKIIVNHEIDNFLNHTEE